MNTELSALFKSSRLRVTTPRLAVLDILQHAKEPLSIAAIAKNCPTVDKASIYRTIDLFSRIGVVTNVPHGWKQRYELAAPLRPHHHHLYCTGCGAVIDIHPDGLERFIAQTAARHSFQAAGHVFEISGLCSNCRANTTPPEL